MQQIEDNLSKQGKSFYILQGHDRSVHTIDRSSDCIEQFI